MADKIDALFIFQYIDIYNAKKINIYIERPLGTFSVHRWFFFEYLE